ncbi:ki-ras-induced actin-interacting protein-IP3R-interacting domain olf186-M isoform X2 [Lycorma delicatula]|uniref:ki-ras-induced actin-interacting protein-IP3R-interacting domain olf186-M isoform X2 n=1 Tax=Lycorma delicatula TaxID=130591 RepID=UPI003F519522
MDSGNSNFHVRVQNFVRKLRPERVRTQLQCLISTVAEKKLIPHSIIPVEKNQAAIDVKQQESLITSGDDIEVTDYSLEEAKKKSVDCSEGEQCESGTEQVTDLPEPESNLNTSKEDQLNVITVDVEVEKINEQRELLEACNRVAVSVDKVKSMSGEYSASSEGDSGRQQRPCELALSREPSILEEGGLSSTVPTLIIDSPNAGGSSTLLCTPSPSPSPRNKSPVTVQEWVDSLPLTPVDETSRTETEDDHTEGGNVLSTSGEHDDNLTLGAEAGLLCGAPTSTFPSVQVTSCREPSEAGSHCSSVESLLEARRADPEEVLLGLGFGGPTYAADTGRIPARFLQPSRLKGVAIDDFLRHQQDLVHNFETGFCGYRGLTGPSHTIPSVIVAKIMEKLREHERESSVASPPRHHSEHHSTDGNKFSRVAHNVLTKIRCVPGSVLTPDNRKWLDSQGDKSPELARRRLIIGQQSFTFSRDGDLIESPPSSLTDSDRWTSSTGTAGLNKPSNEPPSKEAKISFPSIEETDKSPSIEEADCVPIDSPVFKIDNENSKTNSGSKHLFANVISTLLVDKSNDTKLSAASSFETSEDNDKQWTVSIGDSGLPSSGRSSRGIDDLESPNVVQHDDGDLIQSEDIESDNESKANNKISSCNNNNNNDNDSSNNITDQRKWSCGSPCSSKRGSIKSNVTDDLQSIPPVEIIESLDKVIESIERIIEPLEASCKSTAQLSTTSESNSDYDKERIKKHYQDLCLLIKQLSHINIHMDCGTEAQFLALTPNERSALQCRIVRHALGAYHSQLTSDDMHMELKTCLGIEVQKLADLLDTTSDGDKLATIVTQMTSLLEHQADLGQQLKELSLSEEPLACHELCEVVMRRIRGLEMLVRRNARELAEMRKRTAQ